MQCMTSTRELQKESLFSCSPTLFGTILQPTFAHMIFLLKCLIRINASFHNMRLHVGILKLQTLNLQLCPTYTIVTFRFFLSPLLTELRDP